MYLTLAGFAGCAMLIFYSGKQLSRYGDIISDHLGLGKAWVGLIMLATVTSLPELSVGISSVSIVRSADLALGDVLGSCVFNLFILSLLDALTPKESLFSKTSHTHILAAAMSMILVALVGSGLFLPEDVVVIKWIGFTSLVFIAVYLVAVKVIFSYEIKSTASPSSATDKSPPPVSLKRATGLYLVNAAVVVGAALFLPRFAEEIARETGLGESFTGTLFLAASTSLPEIAVSVAAIRSGLLDMAVGNLLGSNMFNILILAVDDMFYTKGELLKDADDSNLVSVFSVIIMTSIATAGLIYQSKARKRFLLAWDTFLILLVFIFNLVLLYFLRK